MNNQDKLINLYQNSLININGEIMPAENAKISIFDRGFLYGDSIYEVAYSIDGSLIYFDDHIDRLYKSASLLNMQIYYSRDEVIKMCKDTLIKSKIKDAYIRIIITRGESAITLDPGSSFKNNIVIIVKPKPAHPQSFYSEGIKLSIVSILRNDSRATNPSAKSGNYLNNVLAINEARALQYDDALMVNRDGFITEGSSFNIWMIKDGIIYTPPGDSGLLKGITREKLIELCDRKKIEIKIQNFKPDDLIQAQEAFITSSTRGIMPIGQINDTFFNVSDYKLTDKLIRFFKEEINSLKTDKYKYL